MGPRDEIDQRIWDTADELSAKQNGRTPPVAAVRIAAQADQNRVSEVMRAWRAEKLAAAGRRAPPLPATLREEAERATQRLWDRSVEAASSARGALLAAEWEEQRRTLETDVAELSARNRELEARLEANVARERELIERAVRAEEKTAEAARREAVTRAERTRAQDEHDALRGELAVATDEVRRLGEGVARALSLAERRSRGFNAWLTALTAPARSDLVSASQRAASLDEARRLSDEILETLRELAPAGPTVVERAPDRRPGEASSTC